MKLYILTISFAFLFQFKDTYAQESNSNYSYKITTNTSEKNNQYFVAALENANMESYRLKNKNVSISFKEGVTCIIISASELSKIDNKIDINNYKESFTDGFTIPIFSVNPNGILLAEYKKKLK